MSPRQLCQVRCLLVGCLFAAWSAGTSVSGQESKPEYRTAGEAKAAAAPHLRSRNYAAAQGPLEQALQLTPETDTRERVNISRMLMTCYRVLPEPEKMTGAVEYIQQHSDQQAERGLVARDYANFMQQRGKTDEVVSRYEARLKKDPKDPAALAVLTAVYRTIRRDEKDRGQTFTADLEALDKERATAKAKRLAEAANANPTAVASNWKDVAKAWLEAGNREQALAAVEISLTSPPEARSELLTMFWREGLGDVLLELDDRDRALAEYEKALAVTPVAPLKKGIEAKIEKAKKR
jgi:tetratricopeptide (TPR) repeat protein